MISEDACVWQSHQRVWAVRLRRDGVDGPARLHRSQSR